MALMTSELKAFYVSCLLDSDCRGVYFASSPGQAKQSLASDWGVYSGDYLTLRAQRVPWLDDLGESESFEAQKRMLEHCWYVQIGDKDCVFLDDMTDELWERLKQECEVYS